MCVFIFIMIIIRVVIGNLEPNCHLSNHKYVKQKLYFK